MKIRVLAFFLLFVIYTAANTAGDISPTTNTTNNTGNSTTNNATNTTTKTPVATPTPSTPTYSPPKKEENLEVDTSFAYLLILAAMLLTFLFGYLIEATHFQYLHEAGVAIILGMIIGALVRYTSSGENMRKFMVFDQETFFFMLLPPIIFESGYNMQRGHFFYNMGSICLFAFAGTLISSMVIGGGIYLTSGVLGWGGNLSFIESFLFGALISATDPVTTLAIFSALKVQKNLYADVFGESVLNDAVAIIFYKTLVVFVDKPFDVSTILLAGLDFCKVFFGSLFIAVLIGVLSALLFKHIDLYKHPILEMLLVILYAFATYLLAQGLQLSGIVAILFVGITMAHYTLGNLSKESQIVTKKMFKVVATLCETSVFIYLGMAIFSFESNTEYNFGLVACALPILGISRALNIFPLAALVNLCRVDEHKIPMKHQIMLWFSGLRGAIAFALALEVPTPNENVIFTTTLIIVLFTALIMGGLTIPMLKYLNIEMGGHSAAGSGGANKNDHEKRFAESSWFMKIDRNYLKPFFTKTAQGQIVHRSSGAVHTSVPLSEIKTIGKSVPLPTGGNSNRNSEHVPDRTSGNFPGSAGNLRSSDRTSQSPRTSGNSSLRGSERNSSLDQKLSGHSLSSSSSSDDDDDNDNNVNQFLTEGKKGDVRGSKSDSNNNNKKKKDKKKERRTSVKLDPLAGYGLGIPPPTNTSFGDSSEDSDNDDDKKGDKRGIELEPNKY